MHLSEALGQAGEAIGRLERLLEYKPLSRPEKPEKPTAFDVCYDHVSFSYPGATQKAVDGISFSIPQGKKVALVGTSGGGKTTIARLLPRFWDADEGEIRIGHVNIKHIAPEDLMQHVSFVFQNPHLLKTTLRKNLKYGNPEAGEEEINRALDLVQCREIIDRLPEGLDTKIGTEGTYLSGGERQRIALARAILKNAPIIVLDEATAYADPENEHLIQQALRELTAGKTVLTIAHRLSSITDADRILVIDKGRIVEQGTHEELLKQTAYTKPCGMNISNLSVGPSEGRFTMLSQIRNRFALSEKGAKDFCQGVFWTVWLDVALMLPAVYVFLYLQDWIRPVFNPEATIAHGTCYYGLLGIAFMAVMYVIAVFQYRSTYTCVYDESANRRISLAEKLRKLPLAFFGEKNLSDLTATIMDDCTELESHFFACRTATHCVSAQHPVDYDRHGILRLGHLHSLCFGWFPYPWPSSSSPKGNCTSRTERTT